MNSTNTYNSITIIETGNGLTIYRKWFETKHLFSIFLFSVVVLAVVLFINFGEKEENGIWMLVILTPWFMYVLYHYLACLLNTTIYTVTKKKIMVIQRPLPLQRELRVPVAEISKIVENTRKYVGRNLRTVYDIHAVTKNNKVYRLERNLNHEHTAEIIINAINKFLQLGHGA